LEERDVLEVEVRPFEQHGHDFFVEEVRRVAEDMETAGEEGGRGAGYWCVFDVDDTVVEGSEDDTKEVSGLCAVAVIG